jgi:hypothetical protein
MDVTLVSIGGSVVVVLIALIIGFKKVLDALSESSQKLEVAVKTAMDVKIAYIEEKLSSDIATLSQVLNEKENTLVKELQAQNSSLISNYEKNSEKVVLSIGSQSNELLQKYQFSTASIGKLITNSSEATTKEVLAQLQSISKVMDSSLETSSANVTKKLDSFLAMQDKYSINIKSKIESNFSNMLQLVNNLRLDNLINVSNEISKYKEGTYEDKHFLQEVGHCKIIKLTDKNNGEVTHVYYDENGEKSHTETFDKDVLKYAMKYENGKLKNGVELNQNGEILFEYFYDDAEEVSKKIEYIYDEKAKLVNKKETNY